MKFLWGLGLGFVGAVLFAPARGAETRRRVVRTARQMVNASQENVQQKVEQVAEAARERAGEIGSAVGRQAAEAVVDSLTNNSANSAA